MMSNKYPMIFLLNILLCNVSLASNPIKLEDDSSESLTSSNSNLSHLEFEFSSTEETEECNMLVNLNDYMADHPNASNALVLNGTQNQNLLRKSEQLMTNAIENNCDIIVNTPCFSKIKVSMRIPNNTHVKSPQDLWRKLMDIKISKAKAETKFIETNTVKAEAEIDKIKA